MKLVIAEKPSVGMSIASVLKADKKCGGPRALLPAARRAGIQENFNFLKL